MNVSIINAYGRSNRGDSVLLDECISEIRQVDAGAALAVAVFEGAENARSIYPEIEWCERIGNTARSGPAGRVSALCYLAAAWAATRLPAFARVLPKDQRRTYETIRDSKLVVSAPGGYIHDTNFAYFIALFHIHLAKMLGRTVILAPQSIGPIKGGLARWVARKVLAKSDFICPRESYSLDFLTKDLGLKTDNIRPCGDSAFWNDHVDDDQGAVDAALAEIGVPHGAKILGVTAVSWNFPHHPDAAAANEAYIAAMARIIDTVAARHGLTPVIFNQVSADLPTARAVAARASSAVIVDEISREPNALRAMIARSSVFLGTRFHSCIFAMMANVPTVAIAYLPKTSYIMKDLRLEDRQLPIDAIDAERAIALLEQDLADLGSARQAIRAATQRYRDTFARLQDVVLEALGRRP